MHHSDDPRVLQSRAAASLWAELILQTTRNRWSFGSLALDYGPDSVTVRARRGDQIREAAVRRTEWWQPTDSRMQTRWLVDEVLRQLAPMARPIDETDRLRALH